MLVTNRLNQGAGSVQVGFGRQADVRMDDAFETGPSLPPALDAAGEAARILEVQRAAQRREGPPVSVDRHDRLMRLANMLRANKTKFADAISADFGHRPQMETFMLEIAM